MILSLQKRLQRTFSLLNGVKKMFEGKKNKKESFVYSKSGMGTLLIFSKKSNRNVAEYLKNGEAIFLSSIEEQPPYEEVKSQLKKLRRNT